MKEVVHCKILEQWIKVKEYLNYRNIGTGTFYNYPYIFLFEDNAGNETWVKNQNPIIFSFAEWCRREGIINSDEDNLNENYNYLIEFLNKLGIK